MKHFCNVKKNSVGSVFIEALVALSVLVSVVVGPLSLAIYSLRSASISQNQFTALYLAQEAMEFVRNYRDTNIITGGDWLGGIRNCRSANGCVIDVVNDNIEVCDASCPKLQYNGASGFYGYYGEDTIFTRRVNLSNINNNEEKVSVVVYWNDKFGQRSFSLEESLFDWGK